MGQPICPNAQSPVCPSEWYHYCFRQEPSTDTVQQMGQDCKSPSHCHCICCTDCSGNYCPDFTALQRRKKRSPKSPTPQCGEENCCEPSGPACLTHLVNLHEFRVGSRPFYGHFHDIRRRRHCATEEVRSRWKRGSYCVDGHTCLHLTRNDKKKAAAQRGCKASLLHHFLFSMVYEKCSPWCLGTEATGAQSTPPQVPTERWSLC